MNIIKKTLISIITSPSFAKIMLKPILRLDNKIYQLISILVLPYEGGHHPKHEIIKYHDWFINELEPNSIVLDIGSNTGNLLTNLAPHIKHGYGIEILENLAKQAQSRNKNQNIEFTCGDATKFDFSTLKKINSVTLSNVLEHIENRVVFLKDIIKSLNDRESVFLIRVPLITRDWLPPYKKQLGIDYRLDRTHFTEYTEKQILEELNDAGLRVIKQDIRFGEIFLKCKIAKD